MKPRYNNGQITHQWKDGYLTIFFENGDVKAEGPYVEDKMEGEWKFYKKEGFLWNVGHFFHDEKRGEWIRYDSEGHIVKQETFE